MDDITKRITDIHERIKTALDISKTERELEQARLNFLTRNAGLAQLLAQLKEFSAEQKRIIGPLLNNVRDQVFSLYEERKKQIQNERHAREQKRSELFDVTAYQPGVSYGSLHPYTIVGQKIEDVFTSMGYTIADGPELEDEWHNFDALNVPAHHPARDMQDTLWLTLPQKLMRTHTSNVQIRVMQERKPPLAVISSGRAYRYEATDATHDYMFMQTEALLVAENISVANLLATIKVLLQAIFDRSDLNIRVRPSYFPFVEPGMEVDMQCVFCTDGCSVCKYTKFIEMAGVGMVHPNVLTACGLDPKKYNGFAFGFGLTRLVMLRYGINDIRLLSSGNLEFLTQF